MREHSNIFDRRTFIGGTAVLGVVSLLNPAMALAEPTSAGKQAEAQSALASLNSMQASLDQASNTYYTAVGEQEEAQAKMADAQARADEATKQIGGLQGKLGTRARSMYRSGGASFIDLLLGAATFEEFATSWGILNQMNENDAEMVQLTKDLRSEVETQKAEYTKQEKIAAQKTAEAKKVAEEASATVASMQATYNSLSAEAAALLEQEKAAQAAAEAAAAARVVEQAAAEASRNNGGGSSGGDNNGGGGNSGGGGSWGDPGVPAHGSVVDYAVSRLGSPYVWGATGPNSFDCSGLVQWCYSQIGISVPRVTTSQMGLPRVSNPQPGDIAVNSGHAGIYVGGGSMIHAPEPGDVVKYGPVQGGMIFVRP